MTRPSKNFPRSGLEAGTAKNKSAPQHPGYEALDRLNETLAALQIDTALFGHAAADIGRRIRQEKERTAQNGF